MGSGRTKDAERSSGGAALGTVVVLDCNDPVPREEE